MNTVGIQRELTVFPTELALRRFQQKQALENGWVDASGQTTLFRLRKLCMPYAKPKGRRMGAAERMLVRRHVVEVARGHYSDGGPLGDLSEGALANVLDKLVAELSLLPEAGHRIVDWLLDRPRNHKLHQLGILYSIWRAFIKQEGLADQLDVNAAILRLLKGAREYWPPLLRDARRITFRSVRWFNPFDESCLIALNHKVRLRIESALPSAHTEAVAEKLGQRIQSKIMAEPWAGWAEDLGDALAVDCPDVLQFYDAARIDFSRSAGAYGEIEDLARRIAWHLQTSEIPANRIALVVPDLGKVHDIVPSVFSRFGIPYFFRRGRPVLSSPCVKAFLAWLAFPLRPERDPLIDLIRNPSIRFDSREEVVGTFLEAPPRIDPASVPFMHRNGTCSGRQAVEILEERMIEPEDHFNAEALKMVKSVLEEFGEQPVMLRELVDLIEELLENATVPPRDSHEQGVWILNPYDAVDLDFNLVLFAGLNEGEFPSMPPQDALLGNDERAWLRRHLEEEGIRLPKLALAPAETFFAMQSVMFLAALGMAREQLVVSCQAVDQEGNEKSEGEFYCKVWNLAGWSAQEELELNAYDQWRIAQLGDDCIFAAHWAVQQQAAPEDRVPMPSESFLPVVPLPLCRSRDEALQVAVQNGQARGGVSQAEPDRPISHLAGMLEVEADRTAYLETPVVEREASAYCGHIHSLRKKIVEWFDRKEELSPTALETLAQCRYVFLLERIFGLKESRVPDDAPDPMERGGLVHSILQEIYSSIAVGKVGIDSPRRWAVRTSSGWTIRSEGGVDAIPLAVFVPEHRDDYVRFAERLARHRMEKAVLGHPGVWAAEREKVLEQVLNFVRYDADNCAAEGRFPALFEFKFGKKNAVDLDVVKLHGVIDRIDLVFADTGELGKVRVLDYKGPGRARAKREDYIDEIRRNLDCQLPVYAFAAQQYFFGEYNTPTTNSATEAGYLFYQRDLKEVGKSLGKSLLSLDEPELVDAFLETLHSNIHRLKYGDFAVDPLVETYTDYVSVCRTGPLRREDLDRVP